VKKGKIYCFGYDYYGQCGAGSRTTYRRTPVQTRNLTNVKQVSASSFHACAVTTDKKLYCWGSGSNYKLGLGNSSNYNYPRQVRLDNVAQVSAGSYHTCAMKEDGSTYCWGYGYYGTLANGNHYSYHSPTRTRFSTAKSIHAGKYHTCIVTRAGTVQCAGYNSFKTVANTYNNSQMLRSPVNVANMSNVKTVHTGEYFNCALHNTGTIRCWGRNNYGMMGIGTTGSYLVNTRSNVYGITDAGDIDGGLGHVCATLKSGTVKCWGYGSYGNLGDGRGNYYSTRPVTVTGISNAAYLSESSGAYNNNTCVVLRDNSMKCWGYGYYANLGNGRYGTSTNRLPVTVQGVP
jgi:alpha-tubulin suppressor-like RCC1 family protein